MMCAGNRGWLPLAALPLLVALAPACGGKGGGGDADGADTGDPADDTDADGGGELPACGPLETDCGAGVCADLQEDPMNCGACGTRCGDGRVCARGRCKEPPCPPGLAQCSGGCVDLATSDRSCGACGAACAAAEVCAWGNCVPSPCPFPLSPCGARCVNVMSDADHCGGCGRPCPSGQVCADGVCARSCTPPETGCGGDCTLTIQDPANCGACFALCPAGAYAVPACDEGTCGYRCVEGAEDLGDGSCKPACADAETCDGADDDCDGATDEDFACVRGAPAPCTTACGSQGSGTCTWECAAPDAAACVPPAESCNGADDDCDGATDNGFPCVQNAASDCVSVCGSQGTRTCAADCALPVCQAPAETCNGVDDDCDGVTDDGYACVQGAPVDCTTSCGTKGAGLCTAACELPAAADCAAPRETCNRADDNCDGLVDESLWAKVGGDVRVTTHPGDDREPAGVYDGENYGIAFVSSARTSGWTHPGGDPAVMWVKLTYSMTKEGTELVVPQYVDEGSLYASETPSIVWASTRYGLIWKTALGGTPAYGMVTVTPGGSLGSVYQKNFTLDPSPPAVAWTGSEYFVTFKDQEGSAGQNNVKYGRVSATLSTLSWAPRAVAEASGFVEKTPGAWNGSRFGVAWGDDESGDQEIYFALLAADGAAAGSKVRVTSAAGDSFSPSVAWGASRFALAWVDRRDGPSAVYFATLDAAGARATATDVRITTIGTFPATQPHVAAGSGEFAVVWKDARSGNDEVYLQRMTPGGVKIGAEVKVSSTAGSSRNPFVLFDGFYYIVLWDDDTPGNKEIYAARLGCAS